MRLIVRWGVAIAVSLAMFALSWWACQSLAGLDEGGALGVAGAVLAAVLAVAVWWATREPQGGPGEGRARVSQRVRAGRDAYVAGRDMNVPGDRRGK
jgi:hypothetical protein